nr:hypothetical protein HmN_000732600 [Hymenolepis microstoma]
MSLDAQTVQTLSLSPPECSSEDSGFTGTVTFSDDPEILEFESLSNGSISLFDQDEIDDDMSTTCMGRVFNPCICTSQNGRKLCTAHY